MLIRICEFRQNRCRERTLVIGVNVTIYQLSDACVLRLGAHHFSVCVLIWFTSAKPAAGITNAHRHSAALRSVCVRKTAESVDRWSSHLH
jgi:hypothetical protein